MNVIEQGITPASVSLQALLKRFSKESLAVDSVDLEIEPGELVTLLGPSGCGKTTTLRMIAGLERSTSGSILIDGEDVTRLPAYLRDVTMVFQSYALFPHMNVFENVAYGLRVARKNADDVRAGVEAAVEMVGLSELINRKVNGLSGGQQQRVALARALAIRQGHAVAGGEQRRGAPARALAIRPRGLLFDEPLSRLAAELRRRVREEIRQLQQDLGITTVYVTHDQEEALAISDRIVVMSAGRIEQLDGPEELYTAPASRFVADFIGSANFLRGHYDGSHVQLGSYSFPHEQDVPPGDYELVVRPEAVEFAEEGLPAVVRSNAYLGPANEYWFDTDFGEIFASLSGEGRTGLDRGDRVHLRFRPAGVFLLRR